MKKCHYLSLLNRLNYPPKTNSKTTVKLLAAMMGTLKYWIACKSPINCDLKVCALDSDPFCIGSRAMLLTSSSPYFARNRRRLRIIKELKNRRPA